MLTGALGLQGKPATVSVKAICALWGDEHIQRAKQKRRPARSSPAPTISEVWMRFLAGRPNGHAAGVSAGGTRGLRVGHCKPLCSRGSV